MSSLNTVPKGADLEAKAEAATETDDGHPAKLTLELYRGTYSQGYKTDYRQVPTRWILIEVRDPETGRMLNYDQHAPRRHCRRYTGKRYDQAVEHYRAMVDADETLSEVLR